MQDPRSPRPAAATAAPTPAAAEPSTPLSDAPPAGPPDVPSGAGRTSSPSWVSPAPARTGAPPAPTGRAPATLVAAAVLIVALAVAEAAGVATRDEIVPALRGFLVVVIAAQLPLARLAVRRSSGAALLLMLFQVTAVVAALAGSLAGIVRLGLGAGAAAALALLAASLHAFPTATLPPSNLRPGDR